MLSKKITLYHQGDDVPPTPFSRKSFSIFFSLFFLSTFSQSLPLLHLNV